jgi:hypothetical protein
MLDKLNIKYYPLEVVASYHGIEKNKIRLLLNKKIPSNTFRFKKDGNNLLVSMNYKKPLEDYFYEIYNEVRKYSVNDFSLAFQLSEISGIKQNTIQRALQRFRFNHLRNVLRYINMFHKFIELHKQIEKLYFEALKYTNDVEIIANELSKTYDYKPAKLKKCLLNDSNTIELTKLQTMLEDYVGYERVKNEKISINK